MKSKFQKILEDYIYKIRLWILNIRCEPVKVLPSCKVTWTDDLGLLRTTWALVKMRPSSPTMKPGTNSFVEVVLIPFDRINEECVIRPNSRCVFVTIVLAGSRNHFRPFYYYHLTKKLWCQQLFNLFLCLLIGQTSLNFRQTVKTIPYKSSLLNNPKRLLVIISLVLLFMIAWIVNVVFSL